LTKIEDTGAGFYIPIVDYDNGPKCLLVWGCNHLNSNPDEYCAVNLASVLKSSAKVNAADPRRTSVVARADLWLQRRPGTAMGAGHASAAPGGLVRRSRNRRNQDCIPGGFYPRQVSIP
jgi:hypothetical protein